MAGPAPAAGAPGERPERLLERSRGGRHRLRPDLAGLGAGDRRRALREGRHPARRRPLRGTGYLRLRQRRADLLPGQRHPRTDDLRLRESSGGTRRCPAHRRLPGPGQVLRRRLPGRRRTRGEPAATGQRTEHERHGGDPRGGDRRRPRAHGAQPDDRYPAAPGRPRRRRAGAGVAGGERRAASAGSPAPRGGRAPAGRPAAVADARGPA